MSVAHFLAHHNAVPIGFSLLVLSFGSAFAASEEVRDSVFKEEQKVVSVDNTYIANKDLTQFTPRATITQVTEDVDAYYVAYDLTTIDLVEHVWRDTIKNLRIRVDKAVLGDTKDLGVYVTEQLGQVIDHEISYLREVQEIERQQVSQKVVATEYSGLVGKLLDATTETLPGYIPVVVAPAPVDVNAQVAAAASSEASTPTQEQTSAPASGSVSSGDPNDSEPPTLQILGNNPARVPLGASYADLGVAVTDNRDLNPRVIMFVDGREVSYVSINTEAVSTVTIRYEATDQAGNMAYTERVVEVFDPNPVIQLPEVATTTEPVAEEPDASTSTTSPETIVSEPAPEEATTSTNEIELPEESVSTTTPETMPENALVIPETIPETEQGTSTPE